MLIKKNVDLTCFNTLSVQSIAQNYCKVRSIDELLEAALYAKENNLPLHVLGGGSNVLLPPILKGLVVRIAIMGREVIPINQEEADLVVGAGENWHELVLFSIAAGYRGLENLSLIPGTVGAAPVQNIGAYGVEVKDLITEVSVLDLQAMQIISLKNDQLEFDYRNSLFKKNPGRYAIVSVTFRVSQFRPLKTGYGDIIQRLSEGDITASDVSDAVIAARESKLPDVAEIPNVGSFFKNPVVDLDTLNSLKSSYPDVVYYNYGVGLFKLAAGWLIQEAGWKGYRGERVGVHVNQALVLVNHNHGSLDDILELAERIRHSILDKFGVSLEIEPVKF